MEECLNVVQLVGSHTGRCTSDSLCAGARLIPLHPPLATHPPTPLSFPFPCLKPMGTLCTQNTVATCHKESCAKLNNFDRRLDIRISSSKRPVYSACSRFSSEKWRYAFQLGIRRGRGLYRAPSEQSQSSHVNFPRSRRTSAMF